MTHSNVIVLAQDRVVSDTENSHSSYIPSAIFVQTLTYKTVTSDVGKSDRVDNIKNKMRVKEGTIPTQQRLTFRRSPTTTSSTGPRCTRVKLIGGVAVIVEEITNVFNMMSAQSQTALAADQVTTADLRQSVSR